MANSCKGVVTEREGYASSSQEACVGSSGEIGIDTLRREAQRFRPELRAQVKIDISYVGSDGLWNARRRTHAKTSHRFSQRRERLSPLCRQSGEKGTHESGGR